MRASNGWWVASVHNKDPEYKDSDWAPTAQRAVCLIYDFATRVLGVVPPR
jgi:hypothetical protein